MKSALRRVVISVVFLVVMMPAFSLVFLLIEDHWFPDDKVAAVVTGSAFYVLLVGGWLLIWGPRLIWNRWRRTGTAALVFGAPLIGGAVWGMSLQIDPLADEKAVVWAIIATYLVWLAVTCWLWPASPRERLDLLTKAGFTSVGCPKCKYDLRGSQAATCPECGYTGTLGEVFMATMENHDPSAQVISQLAAAYRRWVKWSAICSVALILLGLLAVVGFDWWNRSRLNDAISRWEAIGGAQSAAAFQADNVPDDQNAAPLLRDAIAAIGEIEIWTSRWAELGPILSERPGLRFPRRLEPDTSGSLSDPIAVVPRDFAVNETTDPGAVLFDPWEASDEALARVGQVFGDAESLLIEAASRPHCVWRSDYRVEELLAGDLPVNPYGLRVCGAILRCRAVRDARAGRMDAAQDRLADNLALARHTRSDLTNLATDYYFTEVARTLLVIEAVHRHHPVTSPRLLDLIAKIDPEAGMQRSMRLGGSIWLEMVQTDEACEEYGVPTFWPMSVFNRRDMVVVVDTMTRELRIHQGQTPHAAMADLSYPDTFELWTELEHTLPQHFYFTDDIWQRVELRLTMIRFSMKLRAMKAEAGQFPDADSIQPPINPETGLPIVYRRVGDGFILANDSPPLGPWSITWRWDTDETPKEFVVPE